MQKVYDLLVVGAGPAGLALAQYAATRGYTTLVLEAGSRPGGRAATSPWLENVPGFPEGIQGAELGARLMQQAIRLGAEVRFESRVTELIPRAPHTTLVLEDGTCVYGKSTVLANGLVPRRGAFEGADASRSSFIFYEPPESYEPFAQKNVCVYGGGNAAGQTILALAREPGCTVHVLMREPSLRESMASYLADRISKKKNVIVSPQSEIFKLRGNTVPEICLKRVDEWRTLRGIHHLFVLLGGTPDNAWLHPLLEIDARGAICVSARYETSQNDVYAIGDTCASRGHTIMAAFGDAARVLARIERT